MKVVNINPILFRSTNTVTKPSDNTPEHKEIKELAPAAPDYAVKTPLKYSKIGVSTLSNGLNLYSYKLENGHRVTIIPMENSPAIVKNYVNVGSMNETDNIKGISHFLEHMAFNGTDGSDGYIKLNQGDSFKKVDEMGGWTNASTNYALTDYVNSTPQLDDKDLETQIKIIASMTEDLTLSDKMIEKEKFPVSSEINMILDNPETIAIDQTLRTLFNIKSSADELVGGSVKHIQNLTRQDVLNYYNKYYVPSNMNLVITGDINPDEAIELVAKNFRSRRIPQGKSYETPMNPIKTTKRKDFINDKSVAANVMIGFAGPRSNNTKEQVLFDIAANYLNSTSARLIKAFDDINIHPELGSEKVSTNPNNPTFLYYTFNCAEGKVEQGLKTFYNSINNLPELTFEELERIKQALLIKRDNNMEHGIYVNTLTGKAIFDGNFDYLTNYDEILNSIHPEDVNTFIKKYFDLNKAAITVVHPKTNQEISFKGNSSKKPLNMNKIHTMTLNNNVELALYEAKSSNPQFNITYRIEQPKSIKPGVKELLDLIMNMGTKNLSEENYNKLEEKNNLITIGLVGKSGLTIYGASRPDKFELTVNLAKDLLYNPAITEENLEKAKNKLKEGLLNHQKNTNDLYINNESKINPLYTSTDDILENLESITTDEIKEFHQYILNNSYAFISMAIPESGEILKDNVIRNFNSLRLVKPKDYTIPDVYKDNTKVQVLTHESSNSQADIMETFKFPLENSIKEYAISHIMNTILSSSSTIGLFNNLREKEHLAYSVYSDISRIGNCGELSLNILTTTDNKEIGEISYNNLQKSINGFNRQITALKNSEYSDSDLESAKRSLKAALLQKESTSSKLKALSRGLKSKYGIDFDNQVYNIIDSITREDINEFAEKVFKNPPIYSIVASKDTLDANKEFLESLKDKGSL